MNAKTNITNARLSKNGKYLIVESGGQNAILNANLVRYLLDVPYTRNDGTHISNHEIFLMKQKARLAYEAKVKTSAS